MITHYLFKKLFKKIDQRIFLFENEKIFGTFLCTESESESEHKN